MSELRLPVLAGGVSTPEASADLQRIAADLARLIDGEVRFGRHDRMLYATDASIYQVEPLGVVVPRTIADVERVVGYAAERGLPLLARGGGTSLAGQTVNRAVVIDFSAHCRGIVEVDAADRAARVEPGVVLEQLNRRLAEVGLMFGPDVATSAHATIGGMISNNSAGAYSILYGRTVENLLGVDVLLADGSPLRFEEGAAARSPRVREITERVAAIVRPLAAEIRARYPTIVRHVDGYNLDLMLGQIEASAPGTLDRVNLAHLVCGAEGTLAIVTGAHLKLVETPPARALAILGFADVDAALASLRAILATKPAAVELVDDVIINLARENLEYRRYVDLLPAPPGGAVRAVLYVEYFGRDHAELAARFDALHAAAGAPAMQRHVDPAAMALAWKLRKAGEPLLHSVPGLRKPVTFIEDTAVAPARLPQFVRDFRAIVERHGTTAAYYAHASVGCLHIRPLVCLRDPADLAIVHAIATEVTDLVKEYGGALSGEHGDGRIRSPLLERFYGPAICDALRRIKAIFDPENRLNPGNITAPAGMTDHLRVRPEAQPVAIAPVDTFYRYEREHGFGEAVEMCNGAGVCRKTRGGTMCPSYRATLDERHATRGRGNALRLAISGQFSSDGRSPSWDDAETMRTLDLCLSCKACKSECPSNVDIARLKAEYAGQRHRAIGRVPLGVRLVGRVRAVNRLGSALHPIANFMSRRSTTRWLMERVLGIDRRRSLPPFSPSLARWMKRRRGPEADRPALVLLPDCFTMYNESHIGRAAVRLLEAFGYRVVLPRAGCCGRSLISVGMMDEARGAIAATAGDLLACAEREQAVALVGVEPSCVSAIRDDWPDLRLALAPAALAALAAKTWLVEEFLDRHWDRHPRRPALRAADIARPILLHGHCHQKALWGIESSSRMLSRAFGARVRPLDTGCCGLAGSFGYPRGRFDLSMKIAGLSLLPALEAEPDAIIIAPGTSCRHQVRDALGREAIHPIELLAQALG